MKKLLKKRFGIFLFLGFLVFMLMVPHAEAKGRGGGYRSYKGARAIDGDTFRYKGERYRIRQYNAPELGQPGSREATKQLQRKLDSGDYRWKPRARDAYDRTIVEEKKMK